MRMHACSYNKCKNISKCMQVTTTGGCIGSRLKANNHGIVWMQSQSVSMIITVALKLIAGRLSARQLIVQRWSWMSACVCRHIYIYIYICIIRFRGSTPGRVSPNTRVNGGNTTEYIRGRGTDMHALRFVRTCTAKNVIVNSTSL